MPRDAGGGAPASSCSPPGSRWPEASCCCSRAPTVEVLLPVPVQPGLAAVLLGDPGEDHTVGEDHTLMPASLPVHQLPAQLHLLSLGHLWGEQGSREELGGRSKVPVGPEVGHLLEEIDLSKTIYSMLTEEGVSLPVRP